MSKTFFFPVLNAGMAIPQILILDFGKMCDLRIFSKVGIFSFAEAKK
jgi:hypothetical protein